MGVKTKAENSAVDVFAENFVNDTEKSGASNSAATEKFITLKN